MVESFLLTSRTLSILSERRAGPAFINGGAIIDHRTPRERRFVAVEK